MGFSCQILIKRPNGGIHKAGESVTGIVRYAVDEPEEYKDIVLSFVGKGICSWNETRYSNKGIESVTYTGTEIYTAQYVHIHENDSKTSFTLPVGTYEYHFRFCLPKDIPPTFENEVCSIKYKITLKFEKPNCITIQHKTFGSEVQVHSYVKPESPEGNICFGLYKTIFKPFAKKAPEVIIKGKVSSTLLNPGENANLTYEVVNDTNIILTSVKTELICYTTYKANCGREKRTEAIIRACTVETPEIPSSAIARLSNSIRILPNLCSIQNCKIVEKTYKLKVTVRLPMPFMNASTEIPLVIGEVSDTNNTEISVLDTANNITNNAISNCTQPTHE